MTTQNGKYSKAQMTFYNEFHQKAVEDGTPLGEAHTKWMYDLLSRLLAYWKELDTPLPHIDLFDETVRAVQFEDEVRECMSVRTV